MNQFDDNMILLVGVGLILLVGLFILRRVVPFFKWVVILIIGAMVLTVYQNGNWPWQ